MPKKTKNEDLPQIGAKIFMVHKKYADENIIGGTIIPVRVKTFKNVAGKIEPVCTAIGARNEPDPKLHYLYTEIGEAIDAIRTK